MQQNKVHMFFMYVHAQLIIIVTLQIQIIISNKYFAAWALVITCSNSCVIMIIDTQ